MAAFRKLPAPYAGRPGLTVSSVIDAVDVVEMFPAASLYWTHTVFEPLPEGSEKLTSALYGLTAVNGVTNVALEQSEPFATR